MGGGLPVRYKYMYFIEGHPRPEAKRQITVHLQKKKHKLVQISSVPNRSTPPGPGNPRPICTPYKRTGVPFMSGWGLVKQNLLNLNKKDLFKKTNKTQGSWEQGFFEAKT